MEIERKFVPVKLPDNLESYPHTRIEQGYLCTAPVVRVRRDGDSYYMTYKGAGMMIREEYNLPLTKEAYEHLIVKADGTVISKTRYRIPIGNDLTADKSFIPPKWFGEDVTLDPRYHNSNMSKGIRP